SGDESIQTVVGFKAPRHYSGFGFTRQHAFTFRRAGLHGVSHARREVDERWLVESLSAKQTRSGEVAVSRRVDDQDHAARASGTCTGCSNVESIRLRDPCGQIVG